MLLSAYSGSIAAALIGEYVTTPEAHGWSAANTNTQNTAAFNAAIADASTNAGSSSTGRGVVELVQGKTYLVSTTPGTSTDNHAALLITSSLPNVEIRTQGKPIVGSGNQATIQFESWAGKSGVRRMLLLFLNNVSNVKIGWLRFDGNKASCAATESARLTWLTNNMDYSQGGNGAISNIRVGGGNGITLEHVDSYNALTDGLVLSGSGQPSGGSPVKNFLAVDCDFHHNRRMDFGIGAGPIGDPNLTWDQVVFRRVTGRFCGDEAGVMPGNRPGASTDVEPLQINQTVYGLTFDEVVWRDSQGTSFDNEQGGATSYAGGRGIASDTHANVVYFKMSNCQSLNNTAEGFQFNSRDNADYNHCVFENLIAQGNQSNRIGFNVASSSPAARLLDFQIINSNVSLIFFEDEWTATGHSVTIWKGNFNPTITTNGRSTITINDGFPS